MDSTNKSLMVTLPSGFVVLYLINRCHIVYGSHTTSAAYGRRSLLLTINPEHLPAVGGRGYVKIRDLRARMLHHRTLRRPEAADVGWVP